MPIYEYVCEQCGKHSELIQKFSDPPQSQCHFCQGQVRRVVSKTSFQLKGAGWYATDYKKSPASATAASGTSTSDSAPAQPPTTAVTPTSGGGGEK